MTTDTKQQITIMSVNQLNTKHQPYRLLYTLQIYRFCNRAKITYLLSKRPEVGPQTNPTESSSKQAESHSTNK